MCVWLLQASEHGGMAVDDQHVGLIIAGGPFRKQ